MGGRRWWQRGILIEILRDRLALPMGLSRSSERRPTMSGKTWCAILAVFVLLGSAVVSRAEVGDLPLRDNVGIAQVSGGDPSNVFWKLDIGNEEFRKTLQRSLDKVGLLERARGEGQFAISAVLESLDQPDAGFTAIARVRYTLVDKKCAREVYQQMISSEYSAAMWHSVMNRGIDRQMGEGAVRANTAILVEQLLGLSLFQEAVSTTR
jgi:hypothetical protein